MPTEKETLLAVATAEEWREWTNKRELRGFLCLFCRAYTKGYINGFAQRDCVQCCPDAEDRGYGPENNAFRRCRTGRDITLTAIIDTANKALAKVKEAP